jgi:hypothetical protein
MPETNPLIIVQRQTLDWASMTEALYQKASVPFCRLWEKPDDYMSHLVHLWNQTFEYDYFRLRHAIKAMANKQNQSIANSVFVPFADYQNIPEDGAIYTFVDDDDWLSPDLGLILTANNLQQHDAAIWKTCTLGGPRSEHPLFFWGLNGRCMTNNYAVNGRWLNQLDNLARVCQHRKAYHTLPTLSTTLIDAWLSITNKSPCSSVSIEQALGADRTPLRLAQAMTEYNAKLASLQESDFERAPWAWGLFKKTRGLFIEVADSQR